MTAEEILTGVKRYLSKITMSEDKVLTIEHYSTIHGLINDAIAEINAAQANQWIPVSKRLPDNKQKVLCYGVLDGVFIVTTAKYYAEDKFNLPSFRSFYAELKNVTHWQPRPSPPAQ